MPLTPLSNGVNVIITQKTTSGNTPIYPFTRTANVKEADGNLLSDALTELRRSATLYTAAEANSGLVQLSSDIDSDNETRAATPKAVKLVADSITPVLDSTGAQAYKVKAGAATTTDSNGTIIGLATLDENGLVPSAQLPSYVDDVIEGYLNSTDGKFYTTKTPGAEEGDPATYSGEITGEGSKIYVDLDTLNTYRWSGTAYVMISESLALGETAGTAYEGIKGKSLADFRDNKAADVVVNSTEPSFETYSASQILWFNVQSTDA